MDGDTAVAFGLDAFENLHPRSTWPAWLSRCTVVSHGKLFDGRYVVSLSLTQRVNKTATSYFQIAVNASNAEKTILIDLDLATLNEEQFEAVSI